MMDNKIMYRETSGGWCGKTDVFVSMILKNLQIYVE